jgi:hypothetical protein
MYDTRPPGVIDGPEGIEATELPKKDLRNATSSGKPL